MRSLKWTYGVDPDARGFFWPESPQKRSELQAIKRLSPHAAEAVYQLNPSNIGSQVFEDSDFARQCDLPEGIEHAMASPEVREFVAQGAMVVQSWDTAFSADSSSDHSVCVTLLLVPCDHYHRGEDPDKQGPCESHYDLILLDVVRERLTFAEVTQRIRSEALRWQANMILIEKKAYGAPAIETLAMSGLPIEPVIPVVGKRARVIEGLGAGSVQGWFRQHRVMLPYAAPWLETFLNEMLKFTGTKGRTDDQVDAMVHAVGFAIKSGGSSVRLPTGWGSAEEVARKMGTMPTGPYDPYRDLLKMLDPMIERRDITTSRGYRSCGNCAYWQANLSKTPNRAGHTISPSEAVPFTQLRQVGELPMDHCSIHNRRMPAIGTCASFNVNSAAPRFQKAFSNG